MAGKDALWKWDADLSNSARRKGKTGMQEALLKEMEVSTAELCWCVCWSSLNAAGCCLPQETRLGLEQTAVYDFPLAAFLNFIPGNIPRADGCTPLIALLLS